MPTLPEFKLETHFAKWEFAARYHMTASDAESISLPDLLAMASDEDRAGFETMWLGYTETRGAPDLRDVIAEMYTNQSPENLLCFAGAGEGIFTATNVLLDRDSHAIVTTPNYQAHETIPLAICDVSAVPLDPEDNWSLDIDRVRDAIRPNTRLITINFPHNPTGKILERDRFDALIELCRTHGIYVLADEIFNGLGRTGVKHLPHIADVYERGLSLNVTSKAYGLPGLRVGWIACQDTELLDRLERFKHYLSICNAGPSERLALIAIKNRDKLLARNCALIDENLAKLDAFFSRHAGLFDWQIPDGSCTAFPRYLGAEGVEAFAQALVEKSGVLLLPGSLYDSALNGQLDGRFRIGYGRSGMDEGLAALEAHIMRNAA